MPELNNAPVLDQVRDHWQKMAALIVWKMKKKGFDSIKITRDDIETFPIGHVLLIHGLGDGFEFKLMTPADAQRIMAHDKRQSGRA